MQINRYYAGLAVLLRMVTAQDSPLLTTIATIPELSTFSGVINGTGGYRLNPALEERFNSVDDGRKFTALAPTNNAFAKISSAVVEALTAAPAYPILEAIIRTHIAEGIYTSANITSSSIDAIEGFQISPVVTGSNVLVNKQAQIVATDKSAENGVVHEIDQVLNPFTAYVGVSNSTSPPETTETSGSVADIVLDDDRLSTFRSILLVLQPDLLANRMRLVKPEGKPQILAVPSNEAFAATPGGTLATSIAPSNQALSFLFYGSGLLDTDSRFADLNFSAGPASIPSTFTRINVTVSQQERGAAFLNNAAIQEEICGSNGCVWILDRIIDPLYLAFGPADRTG